MLAIVDYGVGNLFSLCSSFKAIGQEAFVSGDAAELANANAEQLAFAAETAANLFDPEAIILGGRALEYLRAAMEGTALSSKSAALLLMKAQALWLEGRITEAQAARDEFLFLSDRTSKGNDA